MSYIQDHIGLQMTSDSPVPEDTVGCVPTDRMTYVRVLIPE